MSLEKIKFGFEKNPISVIKVIGIGGGGGNAVNHMFRQGIRDVGFLICNTDMQALALSPVPVKIQLGLSLTEGRGAGNKPETGREAAIENIDDVRDALLPDTRMVFITAGMGGGTGTGGAPVIARLCHEMGMLTVGIVTLPFRNEGKRRIRQAIEGIREMEEHVDSLLVVNNERIREMYGDFPISQAFAKADDVLAIAARGIAEIITVPGYINVDFADVETVMRQSGVAIMGTGLAEGDGRSLAAAEQALSSPLLNNNNIKGAKNILLNITSGTDEITMDEIGEITDYVQGKAGHEADLIWGNGEDESLGNKISVTIIATGFSSTAIPELQSNTKTAKENYLLTDAPPTPTLKEISTPAGSPGKKKPGETQRTLDFDFQTHHPSRSEFDVLYPPRIEEQQELAQEQPLKVDFTQISDNDLEQLENVPAYVRKQKKANQQPPLKTTDYSEYSVSPDPGKKIIIRDRNPYLDPQVD